MKYLFEEKIRIINLIKGGTSIRSVCKEYGIEYHGLKMWLAQYDAEGEDGIRKSKTPCRYTTKEKEEIEKAKEYIENTEINICQSDSNYQFDRSICKVHKHKYTCINKREFDNFTTIIYNWNEEYRMKDRIL